MKNEWVKGEDIRQAYGLFQSDLLDSIIHHGVEVLDERGHPIKYIDGVFEFHFGTSQEDPSCIIEGVDIFFYKPEQIAKLFASKSGAKISGGVVIPTPERTTWNNIKLRLVNQDRIEISVFGNMAHYTSHDLGFSAKRTLWPLLEQLARSNGRLFPHDYKSLKPNVSNLRKHLKAIFPNVVGDPIKTYTREDGYACNFIISGVD